MELRIFSSGLSSLIIKFVSILESDSFGCSWRFAIAHSARLAWSSSSFSSDSVNLSGNDWLFVVNSVRMISSSSLSFGLAGLSVVLLDDDEELLLLLLLLLLLETSSGLLSVFLGCALDDCLRYCGHKTSIGGSMIGNSRNLSTGKALLLYPRFAPFCRNWTSQPSRLGAEMKY